jgi:hypothetical protein
VSAGRIILKFPFPEALHGLKQERRVVTDFDHVCFAIQRCVKERSNQCFDHCGSICTNNVNGLGHPAPNTFITSSSNLNTKKIKRDYLQCSICSALVEGSICPTHNTTTTNQIKICHGG